MYLVGDFVPQKTRFAVPDFGDELVLANLEGPVCRDGLPPIAKVGPHLHSAPFELKGRWAFTLANNHFMDYCVEGMRETHNFLAERNFAFAGAGESEPEAREPMWLEESGKRIAVICCCEHQFGVATACEPGVAAMGAWVPEMISRVRREGAQIVIVSSHAGSESTKYVSPRLQKLYRSWIDAGADIIHGHHAHVPQGWEEYKGKPIFYGLGNFVVDPEMWKNNPDQLWSLTVKLNFDGERITWSVDRTGAVPDTATAYLEEANAIFADGKYMEEMWRKEAKEQYAKYYRPYCTASLRAILGWVRSPGAMGLLLKNFKTCENHIDIIQSAKGM